MEELKRMRKKTYHKILAKAKEIYHEEGTIDSKTACILLNCKPTAHIISNLVDNLQLSEYTKKRAFEMLKECERRWGQGKYLSHYGLASAIIYLSAKYEGEHRTQKEIHEICRTSTATLRAYKNKIIKAKIYGGKLLNRKERKIKTVYEFIKQYIIDFGFQKEIEWVQKIPPLKKQSKWYFFQEYCWVVINSGMKNSVAKNIFDRFWNHGNFDFNQINHPHKNSAIKEVYTSLEFYFEHLKKAEDKLEYLESLPHIGPITKYHLARNLGLNYAKPDRHLVRIADAFGYKNVQVFCHDVAHFSRDKIGLVDLVLWRFATLNKDYLEIIQKELDSK